MLLMTFECKDVVKGQNDAFEICGETETTMPISNSSSSSSQRFHVVFTKQLRQSPKRRSFSLPVFISSDCAWTKTAVGIAMRYNRRMKKRRALLHCLRFC